MFPDVYQEEAPSGQGADDPVQELQRDGNENGVDVAGEEAPPPPPQVRLLPCDMNGGGSEVFECFPLPPVVLAMELRRMQVAAVQHLRVEKGPPPVPGERQEVHLHLLAPAKEVNPR